MTGDIPQLTNIQNFYGGLSFKDVNFVPKLKHSLLSVSQICDNDFSTHFTRKGCFILKPGIVIPKDWIFLEAEFKNPTTD